MAGILVRRGHLNAVTHTGRMPCEDRGRDQGDAFTKKGTSKIYSEPPEAWKEA